MAYDLSSSEFLADPTHMLAAMRAEGPLVKIKLPIIGATWMTTTDTASREMLKSSTLFARDPSIGTGKTLAQKYWFFPPFMRPLFQNMLSVDGDQHARLRGLVSQAFSRTETADLQPTMATLCDRLLDQIDPTKPFDIVAAYARPFPLLVICALLGIPEREHAKITKWIAPLSAPTSTVGLLRGFPGLWRIMRYFRKDFERVRRSPRPGLINDLVEVDNAGNRLTQDELLAMVVTLFIAGHETTVHLITMGIFGLLENPELIKQMQDHPAQTPLMIEEFMRFFSPVMMTKPHFVQQDAVFQGIPLRKGEQIAALLIAANHDPARFDTPMVLQPMRRPNPHLGFGHGPHVCLGMQLARAEAQTAITQLFKLFPDIAALHTGVPNYVKRIGIHGLKQLMVQAR